MDYSGKIIRKNPVTPSQTSASGVWTLDEALQAQRSNTWPVANVPDPMSRSLRLRSSASANLNRTPSNTATSGTTWTVSYWFKVNVGSTASRRCGFSAGNADATGGSIQFLVTWEGYSQNYKMCIVTGQGVTSITTSGVFRDPSAWYHVVVACDTTQATASNRWKIFVNGVQQAIGGDAFGGSANYPTQNTTFRWNASGQANLIGATDESGTKVSFMDGYIAEFNNIDGQALTPSSFGGTNATTGVWEPRPYTGTYGTNGFLLTFSDITSTATLGNDTSGNSNNWTTNNISLTAGSTYDSMLDVPTQWIGYNTGDVASVTRGNYSTLNPNDLNAPNNNAPVTLSNGNLQATSTNGANRALGTVGVTTGKWYAELSITSIVSGVGQAGVCVSFVGGPGNGAGGGPGVVAYQATGNSRKDSGSAIAYGASYTTGDVIGVALDMDLAQVTFYKNNVSQGAISLTTGQPYTIGFNWNTGSGQTVAVWANFGQRPFTYTPPAGFRSLCTTNLPSPTILQGNRFMDATTYTGNGGVQSITNSGSMAPDFVWTKSRSNAFGHCLFDSVRGATRFLQSNTTGAEGIDATMLTNFTSVGFTLGGNNGTNANGATYVGWQWNAGGSTVTNTAGSISAQVRANTSSGFSVVTYTGNGANATVGHGLGVAPSMIIVKRRDTSANWPVYHRNAGSDAVGFLNTTAAFSSPENTYWNATGPTTSVFSVGTNAAVNASGGTYVAYVFAPVEGYCSIGRYTGNGSTDGPFVYTGFRPRYIMIRYRDNADSWALKDTARDPFNVDDSVLKADESSAESTSTSWHIDELSNGFKIRNSGSSFNTNSGAYIYIAFAENPFKNALAR